MQIKLNLVINNMKRGEFTLACNLTLTLNIYVKLLTMVNSPLLIYIDCYH